MKSKVLIRKIQRALSSDLLSRAYREKSGVHPQAGHCYVAAEALYHALGGKKTGLTAQVARDPQGGTHWWLRDARGRIRLPSSTPH